MLSVDELFKKLVATGIVPSALSNASTSSDKAPESSTGDKKAPAVASHESTLVVKPVDFRKPDTLKV